jgi:EAL domain-containing protein (putative c-di-GMP-specific phosphodiesterase class I)/GGDEF domain-containing protein
MSSKLKKYPISFAKTLIITLLLCATVMVALFVFLQCRETDSWFTELGQRMLTEKSQFIGHRIKMYLDKPRQAGVLMRDLINVSSDDINSPAIERQLKNVLNSDFSHLDSLCRIGLATARGKYVAYERDAHSNALFLIKTSPTEAEQLNIYRTTSDQSEVVNHVSQYNIYSRGWFIHAMTHQKSFWTKNYYHMSTHDDAVMSWRLPLYDQNSVFLGVIFADINPSAISRYLAKSTPTAESTVLLVDESQHIVSSSRNEYLVSDRDRHTGQQQRLNRIEAFPTLKTQLRGVRLQSTSSQVISYEGKDYFVITHPVRDASGSLNWSLVILTPNVHPYRLLRSEHAPMLIWLTVMTVLFMTMLIMLVRNFFRPLHRLVHKTRLLGQQSWEPASEGTLFTEIAVLEEELSNASGLITEMLNEQKQRIEKDNDTGLLTREGFLNEPTLFDNRNLLLMIRITNFRDMRSTLGHLYAKKFIRFFVEHLVQLAPADSLFCRYSEDLFIVVFPGINEHKDLDIYWGIISSLFQDTPTRQGLDDPQAASHVFTGQGGAMLATLTAENIADCMMNAGLALQQIRSGGNREYVLFTPDMRETELNNIRMFQALRDDLLNDGFHLVLQPIVDLNNTKTYSEGECLVRWQSATLGFVPPDVFIGLAERTGSIIQLGRWIIEEACRELSDFILRGAPVDFKLHINISAVQLQQTDFSTHLLTCIQRNGLINSNICLEITESVLLQNSHKVIETLNYLRRLGLAVAIDDFGSGYSSLSYLHLLPFDCLKIDRDFVKGVLDDRKSEAIISSVIMLSQSFGVPLVAEGVETAEMGDKLQAMGCVKAQGYYYSRPQRFSTWTPQDGVITVQNDA